MDRLKLVLVTLLKNRRTYITKITMSAFAIIKTFNVIEHVGFGSTRVKSLQDSEMAAYRRKGDVHDPASLFHLNSIFPVPRFARNGEPNSVHKKTSRR